MNYADHQRMVASGEVEAVTGSCLRCAGWGYTEAESPEVRKWVEGGRKLGSGCTRCLGDGIDPEWAMTMGIEKPNLTACDFTD